MNAEFERAEFCALRYKRTAANRVQELSPTTTISSFLLLILSSLQLSTRRRLADNIIGVLYRTEYRSACYARSGLCPCLRKNLSSLILLFCHHCDTHELILLAFENLNLAFDSKIDM